MAISSNKGKTYLTKRIKQANTANLYTEKANEFREWFERNYNSINLTLYGQYTKDSLHDAYLKMYELILHTGLETKSYKAYIIRSIFSMHLTNSSINSRFCELLPNYEIEEFDREYFEELENKRKELESDILHYVYSNFDIREFELFKMYINLKPAINYDDLSRITGLQKHIIQRAVSKIKKRLRGHSEFMKRRKELI